MKLNFINLAENCAGGYCEDGLTEICYYVYNNTYFIEATDDYFTGSKFYWVRKEDIDPYTIDEYLQKYFRDANSIKHALKASADYLSVIDEFYKKELEIKDYNRILGYIKNGETSKLSHVTVSGENAIVFFNRKLEDRIRTGENLSPDEVAWILDDFTTQWGDTISLGQRGWVKRELIISLEDDTNYMIEVWFHETYGIDEDETIEPAKKVVYREITIMKWVPVADDYMC